MLAAPTLRSVSARAPVQRSSVRVNAFKPVTTQGLVSLAASASLLLVSGMMIETAADLVLQARPTKCVADVCIYSKKRLPTTCQPDPPPESADSRQTVHSSWNVLKGLCSHLQLHSPPLSCSVMPCVCLQAGPSFAVLPDGFSSPQGSNTADLEERLDALIEQRTGKAEALPELTEVPEVRVAGRRKSTCSCGC